MNSFIKNTGWKVVGILLLVYSFYAGLTSAVPRLPILNESIRNLYFHVPMWFGMIALLTISLVYSILYLSTEKKEYDLMAYAMILVATFMGIAGIVTGSVWARFTWGISAKVWWVNDPKLNGAAIGMLVLFAYFILRNFSMNENLKMKFSAVYNIIGYVMQLVFLFVLPRMTASLHPGNGGNPGFNTYDLDHGMRMIFYPAVIGWIIIGIWIATLVYRIQKIEYKLAEHESFTDSI